MVEIPISTDRLVDDLRWLDEHSPPQLDGWGRNRCKWAADRIEALEAALEPFAEVGSSYDEGVTDDQADWPTFKVGQLRAAAAALAE